MTNKEIKHITTAQMQQLITKNGLQRQTKDCFNCNIHYNCYSATTTTNNIKTIKTLENQMPHNLDDGNTYFFTIEKFNSNKLKYNKKLDLFQPTQTTTTTMLIID